MKELTLKATVENIPKMTGFIDAELEANECSMKAQMQIDVAIDELFSNIAYYAYGDETGDATLRFDFDPSTRMASIAFVDGGAPFNPLERDEPDVSLPPEERGIGGLGIFLVRRTMDLVEYRREDGKNILTIHKRI
jgi:anti-sigma regulatory factor (Ser/Thr protein kinase)